MVSRLLLFFFFSKQLLPPPLPPLLHYADLYPAFSTLTFFFPPRPVSLFFFPFLSLLCTRFDDEGRKENKEARELAGTRLHLFFISRTPKHTRKQETRVCACLYLHAMAESIPLKVLFDALHLPVSIEVATGEVYHGTLEELQTNMNVLLKEATKTTRKGDETKMESVFIRGSNVVFFQLPDALQTSPALLRAGEVVSKAKDARGEGKGFASSRKRERS